MNCSVRVYQRIIKLKNRASRYWSMFCCNSWPMCLFKSQIHVSKYRKFELNVDIEKNPGPTPMSCNNNSMHIAIQAIWWVGISKTKFKTPMRCNESICSLIYNNTQGIWSCNYSANDLQSIMNIGNQLYSSLSQLTKQSFLMHKELPTVLNVFKIDCEVRLWPSNWYSENYKIGTISSRNYNRRISVLYHLIDWANFPYLYLKISNVLSWQYDVLQLLSIVN